MAVAGGPDIVENGLVLCLDAGNSRSYPGSGTTWTDLSGNGYNFTLTNSPVFGTHKGTACFTFSGANDYATRSGSISHNIATACTFTFVMASINNGNFGICSRLFSTDNSVDFDYTNYFCLASCDQTKFGLWYKNNPGGLYPTSSLKTADDDYKMVTYKWTAGSNAYVFVNGIQESSSAITTAFDHTTIQRMAIGQNVRGGENAAIRVAFAQMYNRELTTTEIQQNFNVLRGRFGI